MNPSVKNQRFLPAPFGKGAFGCGIVTAVEVGASVTSIKYHPKSKPQPHRPLAPSVTAKATGGSPAVPAPSGRELFFLRLLLLHIGFVLSESTCCESLSHASGVPAPFGKGAFGCGIDTGRVREVTNCRKPPAFAGGLFL